MFEHRSSHNEECEVLKWLSAENGLRCLTVFSDEAKQCKCDLHVMVGHYMRVKEEHKCETVEDVVGGGGLLSVRECVFVCIHKDIEVFFFSSGPSSKSDSSAKIKKQ